MKYTLAEMKRVNKQTGVAVFTGIDQKGRLKLSEKLYKTCRYYPDCCDAVGCDMGQRCPEYVKEED
jgi:5S rRNA maturation endonuclease (ribonuclease M5)